VSYNSERTIEKTIKSVIEQSYRNIEYIIIDGNSSDLTLDIIKKYDDFIFYYVSEPDNGIYHAMNKGIKVATGELVCILNSDDTLYNSMVIERMMEFYNNNCVDALIGNVIQHDINNRMMRFYSSEKWSPEKLKIGFMPPHPSVFLRRCLFNELGDYNIRFKIAADYELITRFFLNYKISWVYLDIITTSMLIGGVSNSGLSSYKIISKEIQQSLKLNGVKFLGIIIHMRFLFKIKELIMFKLK
jgi:glycosyltransferase involved in cell wall biosynthesis